MRIDDIRERAVAFATDAHEGQTRATGGHYIEHSLEVGRILACWTQDPEVIAAGILHDVLEMTKATPELLDAHFGRRVTLLVLSVSDLYTPQAYPEWNRALRKKKEADRLGLASVSAKLIKLADIQSNGRTIEEKDPEFAKVWRAEKEMQIHAMLDMSDWMK